MKKFTKWFLILHIILGIYALSSFINKTASSKDLFSMDFILMYGSSIVALGIYAVCWQQVIKHLPLSTAYANKAVTVVWGMVLGMVFFDEVPGIKQWIGIGIIILGIVLYMKNDEVKEHE